MNVSFNHLGRYEICFIAFLRVLFDEIRKEEYFQHKEDDNQLDYYHRPQRLAQSHVPETVVVKVEDTVNESLLVHSMK